MLILMRSAEGITDAPMFIIVLFMHYPM